MDRKTKVVYKIEDTQKREKESEKKTSGGKERAMQIAPRGKHHACV